MVIKNYVAVSGYTDYFQKSIPNDPLCYLRDYPTDLILLRLSKINALLFQERNNDNFDLEILQNTIFENLIDKSSFQEFAKKQEGPTRLFASPPLANLIASCLQNHKNGRPNQLINTLEFARNLFKTILIYNQLYYSQLNTIDLESFEAVFKLGVMQQSYLRTTSPLNLITSMKFAFISKFIDEHLPLKNAAISYFKKIQLGNPWLFNKFFMEVLTNVSAKANQGKHVLDLHGAPLGLIREFELNIDNLRTKDISLHLDVVPKPFYLMGDNQAIILDYSFFQYAMEHGFFYSFYQSVLTNDKRFKNFSIFKSYIGMQFFEKYLVNKYLFAIFHRPTDKIIASEKYQDFIIRSSSTDIFIIEVKMTDLHPRTLESLDFEEFKKYLDVNFLSEKEKNGKDKGAAQLIRQIDNLASEHSELRTLLGTKFTKRLNIYPIIICSDVNTNIGGVHDYVNTAFEKLVGARRENFQTIKPLIMMHVDILIEYFGILKRNPATLAVWISDYIKQTNNLKKRYNTNGGSHNYLLSKSSFSNFVGKKQLGDVISVTINEMSKSFHLNISEFGTKTDVE